jgi:primosomal protein N' (replication factor Y)
MTNEALPDLPSIARVSVPAPLYPYNRLFDYKIPQHLQNQVFPGSLVELTFGRRSTWGLVFEIASKSELGFEKLKSIKSTYFDRAIFSKDHLIFLKWLSEYYFYPLGEVCEAAIPISIREGTPKTLNLENYAKTKDVIFKTQNSISHHGPKLNEFQDLALNEFQNTESNSQYLLFGITGSGKTEVYLKMIEHVLKSGKSAIMLVPEIALTPQLTDRFALRFPGEVAVFHSGLKKTESRKSWMDVFLGQKRIAMGARSALFAPVKNIGCLIVDEEHDTSYKQDDRLKYHARDSARKLAEFANAKLVLGSATPSAEALLMARNGNLRVLKLPHRAVGSARLPEIQIVDMKATLPKKSFDLESQHLGVQSDDINARIEGDFFLSPPLRKGLEDVLANKKQAILFLNRRGVASSELCRKCGHINSCPDCDVKLTPHFEDLICHYCGFKTKTPSSCPECSATQGASEGSPFIRIGVGTEAIEKALEFHFPKARILRLDRDTASESKSLFEILTQFKNRDADILIGTQMVAKGHDFPQVTLVGILSADMGLAVPDFRSFEKNAQLLLQVAGRAGRADDPGQVILQTFQPEHPVFELIKSHRGIEQYEQFLADEIYKRKEFLYPPWGRLCVLRFDGLDLTLVREASETVAQGLKRAAQNTRNLILLGPVPSPITKLRSRYRWQILIKSIDDKSLSKIMNWILGGWENQKLEKKFNTRLVVDVDPAQML